MGTQISSWRLPLLISIIVMGSLFMTAAVVFHSDVIKHSNPVAFGEDPNNFTSDQLPFLDIEEGTIDDDAKDKGNTVLDMLSFFNPINIINIAALVWINNVYARFILNTFELILIAVLIYLVYCFAMDWKPDWL